MQSRLQEKAGKIIEAALAAGMLYVQPCVYTIPVGCVCTRCGSKEQHTLGCEPPFGLRVV